MASELTSSNDQRHIWQVSELNRSLKQVVDQVFSNVWVEGEVSNLARPASGHIYFTMKDSSAQIRCVMFRSALTRSRHIPENGDQVLIRASASVYEARGDLQLVCDQLEPVGDGRLQRLFEETKERLFKEGLFDPAHKRPLPQYPSRIAVISSRNGAAFQDFRKVILRRFSLTEIVLYNVLVQGTQAAGQIIRALEHIEQSIGIDVIAMIRGGGSLEDLWAFNDETLARRMALCPIPIITGIGHEIDFTIADFVADQRAPTPSVAAELLTPDSVALGRHISTKFDRIRRLVFDRLRNEIQKTDWLFGRLNRLHPLSQINTYKTRLSSTSRQLFRCVEQHYRQQSGRFEHIQSRLAASAPHIHLTRYSLAVQSLARRIDQSMSQYLQTRRHHLALCTQTLHAVSPLQTINRGYSITLKGDNRQVVRSYKQVSSQSPLLIVLKEGHVKAIVKDCSQENIFTLPHDPSGDQK